MLGRKIRLTDEWDMGLVSLWSPERVNVRTFVPEGTEATVLSRLMTGYLLVEVAGDIWEVWHENSSHMLN